MAADERYATKWRGLLPRFVLASLVIAFAGELLQKAVSELFPFQYYSSLTFTLDVQIVVSFAFFPFAVFALFYLSSRVRIDLGNDYASVAASIFLRYARGGPALRVARGAITWLRWIWVERGRFRDPDDSGSSRGLDMFHVGRFRRHPALV